MAKDPNKLFDLLDAMKDNMESLIEDAQSLVQESAAFTGEISKVMKQQLVQFFIPNMKKLIDDANTPGSIYGLQRFLGSVPLAMTREKPNTENESIIPEDVKLVNPAAPASAPENPVDALPQNASYANKPEEPVLESKLRKSARLKSMRG